MLLVSQKFIFPEQFLQRPWLPPSSLKMGADKKILQEQILLFFFMRTNGEFVFNVFYGRVHLSKKGKSCNKQFLRSQLRVLQKTALDIEIFKKRFSYFEECSNWRTPLKTKNICSSGVFCSFICLLFCTFWALIQQQMMCDEKNNVNPLSPLHKSLHKLKMKIKNWEFLDLNDFIKRHYYVASVDNSIASFPWQLQKITLYN